MASRDIPKEVNRNIDQTTDSSLQQTRDDTYRAQEASSVIRGIESKGDVQSVKSSLSETDLSKYNQQFMKLTSNLLERVNRMSPEQQEAVFASLQNNEKAAKDKDYALVEKYNLNLLRQQMTASC